MLRLASVVDPETCVGDSLATGRVTQAGQVGGETPDEEVHPCPPGLGVRLITSPCKIFPVSKSKEQETGLISRRRLRKRVKDLRLCCWNVLSLKRNEAVRALVEQLNMYKIDIVVLCKICTRLVWESWKSDYLVNCC
ncbi:hypothetical protein TNCV_329921 [Trichonephila clavipes]|nr:hypothetical protein TNCV_329921 [Trichonephila clavipes]